MGAHGSVGTTEPVRGRQGSRIGATRRPFGTLLALGFALLALLGFAPSASAALNAVDAFGSAGSGEGQFNVAGGLAVDPTSGEVLVVDRGNNRVQRFTAAGEFVAFLGASELNAPQDIAAAPDGSFFVTHSEGVVKFAADGTVALEFGAAGSGDGALSGPQGIALGPDGSIYVADAGNNRIAKFDPDGTYDSQLAEPGSGDGALASPSRLAVDSSSRVYAIGYDPNFNTVMKRFNADGSFDSLFAPAVLDRYPSVVTVAADGDIWVVQYAPEFAGQAVYQLNPDGTVDTVHAEGNASGSGGGISPSGLAIAAGTGTVYAADGYANRVVIFGEVTPPEVTLEPVADITPDSASLSGTVDPNGTQTSYRFEISPDGGSTWKAVGPDGDAGAGDDPVPVSAELRNLEVASGYQVRLRALPFLNAAVTSPVESFTTAVNAPRAETVGSPYRTATTARLDARVNPRNGETTYRFEWGTTTAYGNTTPEQTLAAGGRSVLVSAPVEGLAPNTTYHYRVVATNSGGTNTGPDRTVVTRASDAPLSHGAVAGPPGSDRGWEQVSMPDSNGNPVPGALAVSTDGNRVVYGVAGGTKGGNNGFGGVVISPWLGERTASGWSSENIWPGRAQAPGPFWEGPGATADLSQIFTWNGAPASGIGAANSVVPSIWRLRPDGANEKLGSLPLAAYPGRALNYSADGSVLLIASPLSLDPDQPVPPLIDFGRDYLYDFGSGVPELVSLLPGEQTPPCGGVGSTQGIYSYPGANKIVTHFFDNWIAADGSRIFFPAQIDNCGEPFQGTSQLFMRDLDAGQTVQLTGDPDHGPDLGGAFISATPGGPGDPDPAAFFATASALVAADADAEADVYRYDVGSGERRCLTCELGEMTLNMPAGGSSPMSSEVRVSEDGSALFLATKSRLVPGEGTLPGNESPLNLYRIEVASGAIESIGVIASPDGTPFPYERTDITPDGKVIVYTSTAAEMNSLTGSDNGGFPQQYRYDARDGSLLCLTCPPGGASHESSFIFTLAPPPFLSPVNARLSDDGRTFVFRTDDAFSPVDQNGGNSENWGEGADVYEWRDGRYLLVTDGVSAGTEPRIATLTPDGGSVFFAASGELTAEAKDGYTKLYVARIGGGFEIEPPAPPCALEVCQGDPTPPPAVVVPGSERFAGPGNQRGKAPRKRCKPVKKKRGAKKRACKPRGKGKKNAKRNGGSK